MNSKKWSKKSVFTKLKKQIEAATDDVMAAAEKYKTNYREAAFIVALQRLEKKHHEYHS